MCLDHVQSHFIDPCGICIWIYRILLIVILLSMNCNGAFCSLHENAFNNRINYNFLCSSRLLLHVHTTISVHHVACFLSCSFIVDSKHNQNKIYHCFCFFYCIFFLSFIHFNVLLQQIILGLLVTKSNVHSRVEFTEITLWKDIPYWIIPVLQLLHHPFTSGKGTMLQFRRKEQWLRRK